MQSPGPHVTKMLTLPPIVYLAAAAAGASISSAASGASGRRMVGIALRYFMIGPLTNRGHPGVPTVCVRHKHIICGMDTRRPNYRTFYVAAGPKSATKIQLAGYRARTLSFV